MKTVFLNKYFYPDHSATSQLLSDLAFHMAKTGTSVYVITSRQTYDDPDSILPSHESVQGVDVIRVWTTRFGRRSLPGRTLDYLTFYLSAAWSLFVLLKSKDIIVAKTDPPMISVVAAVVARWRGAVLVNWIQDLFPEVAEALGVVRNRTFGTVLRRFRNASLNMAWRNVAIGAGMAERLLKEGIPEDRIHVIHNWSDGEEIYPIDRSANVLVAQ